MIVKQGAIKYHIRYFGWHPALCFSFYLLSFIVFSVFFPNQSLAEQPQVEQIITKQIPADLNQTEQLQAPVRSGSEVLIERHIQELQGKRVGILLNPSSKVGPSASSPLLVDTLLALGVNVQLLFAPEHGVRGNVEAGGKVVDGVDPPTGLPVTSLYGSSKQPPTEILEELDLILFDIQDVGARFYTYISTMGLLMDAALPVGVDVWVLDRPNPAGGEYVSGWMLKPEFSSFVGLYPIPMVHGMTLGELALMMKGEGWAGKLEYELQADNNPTEKTQGTLRVIPMEGWTRNMLWPATGREWIPPSPNLPTFEHAYVYLGMCLVEGTTLSEGRGTDDPFLLVGSPTLNTSSPLPSFPGAKLSLTEFTPRRIPGKSEFPKFQDQLVHGVQIQLTNPSIYKPVESGLELLRWLVRNDPEAQTARFLNLLAGDDQVEEYLKADGVMSDELISFPLTKFRELRSPYLLY